MDIHTQTDVSKDSRIRGASFPPPFSLKNKVMRDTKKRGNKKKQVLCVRVRFPHREQGEPARTWKKWSGDGGMEEKQERHRGGVHTF